MRARTFIDNIAVNKAKPSVPRRTVTPVAAVIQLPAEVVNPSIFGSLFNLRIKPSPIKPMPVTIP